MLIFSAAKLQIWQDGVAMTEQKENCFFFIFLIQHIKSFLPHIHKKQVGIRTLLSPYFLTKTTLVVFE